MNASSDRAKPSLDELIGRLSALHQKRIDLGLERMHRLLERLGHPERKLPPVIHIAGTNGKGSTLAYLRATLEAANLRVHAYTSPYLVRINECFRLGRVGGGVLVGDDELRAALEEVERVNAGEPATVFELKTAAAFHLFAQNPADVVLLEVGLGGRLDSTNVVDAPAACVITPVSMDHMDFLGDTLTSIAGEKAAIIKRGVPVVCAEQSAEAMAVIEAQAKRMRAPLFAAGESWHVNVEHGRLVYSDERGLMDLTAPRLFGRHQFDNAGLAIATLRATNAFKINQAAFEAGIVGAEWPARMQRIASGELLALGPAGLGDLARRRPQCGRRPRRGGRARRSRRAGVAAAGRDRRHDGQQGRAGFSRQFRRFDPSHHRGTDSRHRQRDAGRPPHGCRPQPRHARRARARHRGRTAHLGEARLRSAAAHPDHRLALSRRPRACHQRHAACIEGLVSRTRRGMK